jgi:protein tyrosine/serine phosphatase
MATSMAKRWKRASKRVAMAWRHSLIAHAPPWLKRTMGKPAAYADMLLIDHGLLRVFYLNKHQIAPGVWRAAQPAPHQIASAARSGIKTIVNLRGERVCGSYVLEQQACARHGVTLVNCQVRSRAAPSKQELRDARDMLQRIEYPMLMHCKSGADRAGLMSVLYKHIKLGVPIAQAKDELSLRYGHIRQSDTGVLDAFFERYLTDTADKPMPFFDWVETTYDPDDVKDRFVAQGWANRIVNGILRRE